MAHCLRVVGASALVAPEALKIINGRNLIILTSHDVSGILNSKVNIWVMDREAWRAAIHGVAKSRTRLSD